MQTVQNKSICVMGLGYVGLPSAAIMASRGYQVHGVEVNPKIIEVINSGKAHIVEPDLDILVRATVQSGRLTANPKPTKADVFIICVPTPFKGDHEPDLTYVYAATEMLCPYLEPGNLVVLESTSPPGTTEEIAAIVRKNRNFKSPEVFFAHAPERVLPGRVLREVVENDRIIGGLDEPSTRVCSDFYRTFVSGELRLTNARTAETAKLVENSYRDVNIAFANELSLLADELKLDVWELIRLANCHPRVKILSPGCGVGGHCIAVDPWFLVHKAPQITRMIRTAREVNEHKPHYVVSKVMRLADRFKQPKIACLGLAYKPDIDDLRESPAIEVVDLLIKSGIGDVRVVEPYIQSHERFKIISLENAVSDADIIVVLVGHRQFKQLPSSLLSEKLIVDTCGALLKN